MSNVPDNSRPRLRTEASVRARQSMLERVSTGAGNLIRSAAGMWCRTPPGKHWILCQFYHWVLDDQRAAFRRQLHFLRRHGDFISLDDAVEAMQSPSGIGGRYFCLTFDDGFKNCYTNAASILSECRVPATFFVPTKYIGLDLDRDWEEIAPYYQHSWRNYSGYFEFLDWDECREMAAAGFQFGSHAHSHMRLTRVQETEAERELTLSKQIIEAQLGQRCRHFSCPWGKRGGDFDVDLHPIMARRLGYESFLTTEYGLNLSGDSPFRMRRVSSAPDQGPLMLRYTLFNGRFHSRHPRRQSGQ